MSNPKIQSLAILMVNWDELNSKDYLDNFVPLVSECIRLFSTDIISISDLQKDLKNQFGLSIPQNALRSILNRVKKQGYIKQENKILYPIKPQLDQLNFKDVQSKVLGMVDSLVKNLIFFVSDRLGLSWSQEEAETNLLGYLEENQFEVFNSITDESEPYKTSGKRIKSRYIVGSFIHFLQESNSSEFEAIDILVKGSILANAVYLPDPGKISRKFKKTSVFFDTSFIISALGYAGDLRRAPCIELLEMLDKSGGGLFCYQHTIDEVFGILDACSIKLKQGSLSQAYGPSIEYFIQNGCNASDIELFKSRLNDDIIALKMKIIDKPEYNPNYLIDEDGLTEYFRTHIKYFNPKALQRDVDSISAIVRTRRGKKCYTIEECRAIFVTQNHDVVKHSNDFLYEPTAFPPAITDHNLTTLLWLKSPNEAPDLPRKRIIADCYAATQPTDRLWQKYMQKVDKLEKTGSFTTDDIYALRFSLEAKSILMKLTYGDEEFFTEGTVEEILQIAREHIQREVRNKFNEELKLRKKAELDLQAKLDQDEARKQLQKKKSEHWARSIRKTLEFFILIILFVGALYQFPWNLPRPSTMIVNYIISIALCLLFLLMFYNLWKGKAVNTIMKCLEVRIAHWIEKKLLKLSGFDKVS